MLKIIVTLGLLLAPCLYGMQPAEKTVPQLYMLEQKKRRLAYELKKCSSVIISKGCCPLYTEEQVLELMLKHSGIYVRLRIDTASLTGTGCTLVEKGDQYYLQGIMIPGHLCVNVDVPHEDELLQTVGEAEQDEEQKKEEEIEEASAAASGEPGTSFEEDRAPFGHKKSSLLKQ